MTNCLPAFVLTEIFDDHQYAWRLLETEISLQMASSVSGQLIAKLLELYMKGVEKMNSISDPRESYFKSKVTTLMTKGVVIKSLKQNPMKKKTKHSEIQCKDQIELKKSHKQKAHPQESSPNHIELKQKQKQLQMRLEYSRQQNTSESLRKMILQEECRQENISKKISMILNEHQQRLKSRIKARKLRTATYRTQSVFQQESETQPSSNQFNSNRKQDLYFFPISEANYLKNSREKKFSTNKKQNKRKCKSQQNKRQTEVYQRKRKYTMEKV